MNGWLVGAGLAAAYVIIALAVGLYVARLEYADRVSQFSERVRPEAFTRARERAMSEGLTVGVMWPVLLLIVLPVEAFWWARDRAGRWVLPTSDAERRAAERERQQRIRDMEREAGLR